MKDLIALLRGTVRLIFQPAEKGLRGAASMTAALNAALERQSI